MKFQEKVGTKQFAKLSSVCRSVIKVPSGYRRCKRRDGGQGLCEQVACPKLTHSTQKTFEAEP